MVPVEAPTTVIPLTVVGVPVTPTASVIIPLSASVLFALLTIALPCPKTPSAVVNGDEFVTYPATPLLKFIVALAGTALHPVTAFNEPNAPIIVCISVAGLQLLTTDCK